MATYLALTTTNFTQNGYSVLVLGNNKSEVETKARQKIGDGKDIITSTMHKNLIVVSKTKAKKYGIDADSAEYMHTNHPEAVYL